MGARRACKLADASLVDDSPVDDSRADDSPVDDSRAVDSPVGEIQVAFLSLVDRACQVDLDLVVLELVVLELVALELVVLELVDRACPASEAELADRALPGRSGFGRFPIPSPGGVPGRSGREGFVEGCAGRVVAGGCTGRVSG